MAEELKSVVKDERAFSVLESRHYIGMNWIFEKWYEKVIILFCFLYTIISIFLMFWVRLPNA